MRTRDRFMNVIHVELSMGASRLHLFACLGIIHHLRLKESYLINAEVICIQYQSCAAKKATAYLTHRYSGLYVIVQLDLVHL